MSTETEVKKQLIKHLKGGEAFMPLEDFIDKIPFKKLGERPCNLPYSFYEIFFHIAFAQKDIINFCTIDSYEAPNWPNDYWPEERKPEDEQEWEDLKAGYFEDRKKFTRFLQDESNGLLKTVKKGKDQTLLRETMLVIEHTSYHTGQLLIILRLLGLHS